jgi:diguanylate cyclase (GGDEF)-like protein
MAHDAQREALEQTGLLDSPMEAHFDRFTRLAASLTGSPVAFFSVLDEHRQFFKSQLGMGEPWATRRETPLSHSFCRHVVASGSPLVIEDARRHELVKNNPAIEALGVVSYAGFPVTTLDGYTLGALCVSTPTPRKLSEEHQALMQDLAVMLGTEVDMRREMQKAQTSRATLEGILNSIEDAVVVVSKTGETLYSNRAFQALLMSSAVHGDNRADWLAQMNIFLPDKKTPLAPRDFPMARALAGERVPAMSVYFRNESSSGRWANISAAPVRLSETLSSPIQGAVAVVRDTTQHQLLTEGIEARDATFLAMAQNLPNAAVLLFDESRRVVEIHGGERVSTLGLRGALGKHLAEIWPPSVLEQFPDFSQAFAGHAGQADVTINHQIFALHLVPIRGVRAFEMPITQVLLLAYDVTARENKREELSQLSNRDELTGLLNRRGFLASAQLQMALSKQNQEPLSLFFVDVDGLKRINDSLGHQGGDAALKDCAAALVQTFRKVDVLARLGGDEFVALALNCAANQTHNLKARLAENLKIQVKENRREFNLSASVGITMLSPIDELVLTEVLADADQKMYAAKQLTTSLKAPF